jgi:uncharacterized cupredoxin-like copper-binding protein
MIKKVLPLFILLAGLTFAQFEPKIVLQPAEYSFGEVTEGEVVSYDFTIKNDGNDVLVLKDVRATCGCTAAKPGKTELKPGESTKVKVSFNTDGRPGKQNKAVNISSNDPANSYTSFRFSAVVNPKVKMPEPNIYFKEMTHNFGKVREGKVEEYTFKFTNNGKALLEIKEIKTSCGCTAAIVSSKKVEPGKEGTIRVELDTSNRSGSMARTITVISNDPDEPEKTLTVMVDIQKG